MDTFWQTQHEYTLFDAAFLWLNKPPQGKIPDSDKRVFLAVLNMFISAIRSGDLKITGGIQKGLIIRNVLAQTESRIPDRITAQTRVSRSSLKVLAENKGVRPVFLFPEEQRPEACSLKNDEKDDEKPDKATVQPIKEEDDVSKATMEYLDNSPSGVGVNTIKIITQRDCILTFCGVESLLKGKAAAIIPQLLLNPGKEFRAITFTSPSGETSVGKFADLEYDEESETIQISAQEKAAWQKGMTEILENIRDLDARFAEEEDFEKKTELERQVDIEKERLSNLKKLLAEKNGYVDEQDNIHYRGHKTGDGGYVVLRQKEEYKKDTKSVSKLCKIAIKSIVDENLKGHLIQYIRLGKKLSYTPNEMVWKMI